jgi:hypothetical protein
VADWTRSIPRDKRWGGCLQCVHFRRNDTCIAYPEQIPIVIASGEVDHLIVRPGQVGDTVFEPREQAAVAGSAAAARPDPV